MKRTLAERHAARAPINARINRERQQRRVHDALAFAGELTGLALAVSQGNATAEQRLQLCHYVEALEDARDSRGLLERVRQFAKKQGMSFGPHVR